MSDTVAAYPVAPGRCPHCGLKPVVWTAELVIAAVRAFAESHGRPPFAREWKKSTPVTPNMRTVQDMFGTWNAGMVAAGFSARKQGQVWDRATIVAAILRFKADTGRYPTAKDWIAAGDEYPCEATVHRTFGSWNKARRAAGYKGRPFARISTLRASSVKDMVDIAAVREAVRDEQDVGGTIVRIAEIVGMDESRLRRVLQQERVSLDVADRIITALDRPDLLTLHKDSAAPSLHPKGVDVEVVTANGSQGRPSTTTEPIAA